MRATIVIDGAAKKPVGQRGSAGNPATTLREGLTLAQANLQNGVATRVLVKPGIYRESVADLQWNQGRARETLLILEGTPGQSILSGADVFPLQSWRREGDLLVHDWPHRFANYARFWDPKKLIAHRREMAFIGDKTLRPEVLETYAIAGQNSVWEGGDLTYKYLSLRDPQTALTAGSFGVAEEAANGQKIYLRPGPDQKIGADDIEVSTRGTLLDFGAKHNLVVRGLSFVRCANSLRAEYPLRLSNEDEQTPRDILIDNCRFEWNSGEVLNISGDKWTVRDSTFNYNGFSGISSSQCHNVVFTGCDTSFNV